jgi:hypothetical protein
MSLRATIANSERSPKEKPFSLQTKPCSKCSTWQPWMCYESGRGEFRTGAKFCYNCPFSFRSEFNHISAEPNGYWSLHKIIDRPQLDEWNIIVSRNFTRSIKRRWENESFLQVYEAYTKTISDEDKERIEEFKKRLDELLGDEEM